LGLDRVEKKLNVRRILASPVPEKKQASILASPVPEKKQASVQELLRTQAYMEKKVSPTGRHRLLSANPTLLCPRTATL
jgi:hypothetical protein